MSQFKVSEKGFYGKFGGAFIPEMLYPNVEELRTQYLSIIAEPSFQEEYMYLLEQYVGRPTPYISQNDCQKNTILKST